MNTNKLTEAIKEHIDDLARRLERARTLKEKDASNATTQAYRAGQEALLVGEIEDLKRIIGVK